MPRGTAGRRDLVRVLVDHRDPEVLEQWHHVGQHQRATGAVQLDARGLVAARRFEPQLQIARGIEVLEHVDVADRVDAGDLGLVRRRERVAPARYRSTPASSPQRVDERVVQVVDPVPRGGGQLGLECERVDVGCARRACRRRRAGAPSPTR